MGVKDFTKVFESNGEFTYKEFKGKNVAIDASVEIYRSALGMKMSEALRDKSGNPTSHINTILLGVILKLKAAGANQYWVFDYSKHIEGEEYHNPLKQLELQKRRAKRTTASEKLIELKKDLQKLTVKEDKLFSSDENDEESDDENSDKLNKVKEHILKSKETASKQEITSNINKQEKIAFVMEQFYTDDVIFMLDMLDIPWIECPPGFDAEQIAAFATNDKDILGVKIDYVLTPDVDALLFGCKKLIKRDTRKKKLFKYDLADLLKNNKLTQDNLIKIGLILGTDFATKTPKVGPKTVLKKYKDITLAEDQQTAMDKVFKKIITDIEKKKIVIHNNDVIPFTNENKYTQLLDWLQLVKSYNRGRISKQFQKQKIFSEIS